jgi:hypothetical protein
VAVLRALVRERPALVFVRDGSCGLTVGRLPGGVAGRGRRWSERHRTGRRVRVLHPDELWRLTCLIAGQDQDLVDPDVENVLAPVFVRYYHEQSATPAGDVIRATDWLGNGGFVRNLVEEARITATTGSTPKSWMRCWPPTASTRPRICCAGSGN